MKVVVVAGICVEHDAISAAAVAQADALQRLPDVDQVVVVAQHHDRVCSIEQVTVIDPWSFASHPDIVAADVVILHWGISYALFDALPLIADRPCVVHFHNVTPIDLVPADQRPRIEQSLKQIQLPALTETPFWTMSQFNIDTLVNMGFARDRIRFMPFPIEDPPRSTSPRTPDGSLRLIAVGRLVPAKGLNVLVEAMRSVSREFGDAVSLDIVGSAVLSEGSFVDQLQSTIMEAGLAQTVRVRQQVTDRALHRAYEQADVLISASLHEGLCVPVIEAYRAGCRVVGTDAGNLPHVVQPPDPVVAVGDSAALADAIITVGREILNGQNTVPATAGDLIECYSRQNTERQLADALAELVG